MAKDANGNEVADDKEDTLKNHKAEVDRKIGNISSSLKTLEDTNKALLAQLAAMTPKQPAAKEEDEDDLKSLIYDNPAKAVKIIEDRATKGVLKTVNDHATGAAKEANIIAGLRADYPELYDGTSKLTQRAIEIFNSYPQEDKVPISYKLAVKEAAEELGVLPKGKRKEDDSEPTRGAGGSKGSSGKGGKKGGLDERTIDFAKQMGLNTDDPKVLERLKSRQRDSQSEWLEYQ